jgi:hypothetical protein
MAHHWRVDAWWNHDGAAGDLLGTVLYGPLGLESADMTKLDALRILKLLSALESWAFSTKNPLPPFVDNELVATMEVLEKLILEVDA